MRSRYLSDGKEDTASGPKRSAIRFTILTGIVFAACCTGVSLRVHELLLRPKEQSQGQKGSKKTNGDAPELPDVKGQTKSVRDYLSSFRKVSHQGVSQSRSHSRRLIASTRFDIPWESRCRVKLLSLRESKHRVLLSAISHFGTDGIGHMMATINTEVRISLELGLTYTHRIGQYGSLSSQDKHHIENFFGWHKGEILRETILSEACNSSSDKALTEWTHDPTMGMTRKLRRPCLLCRHFQKLPGSKKSLRGMNVSKLIHIPAIMSWGACSNDLYLRDKRCEPVRRFRQSLDSTTNALFLFAAHECDFVPALSDFRKTSGWFYWKYWDAHRAGVQGSRATPQFTSEKLTVAVHVRRGDFFDPINSARRLIPWAVFERVIQRVLHVTRSQNNKFAFMRTEIYIYSEGAARDGAVVGHDVSKMDLLFYDSDGTVRDANWIKRGLTKTGLREVDVVMRISADTIISLHEMIAADLFIGSLSGLSKNVVASLSRGVSLIPAEECLSSLATGCFHPSEGTIDEAWFNNSWFQYAKTFSSL